MEDTFDASFENQASNPSNYQDSFENLPFYILLVVLLLLKSWLNDLE